MDIAKDSIASVLQQNTNRNDLKKTLSKLLDEIDYYKTKTRKFIDGKYADFLHQLPETETYMETCESLIGDGQIVLGLGNEDRTRETLSMADIELQQYMNEVRKICLEMQILKKILRVDALLEEVERCKTSNDRLGVMEYLSELEELINDKEDIIFRNLDCFENICGRFESERSVMKDSLKQRFNQLVQMTEKQFQTNKLVHMRLSRDTEELRVVIKALLAINLKSQWISDFLLDNIFVPIITRPVSFEMIESNSHFIELKLSFSAKERSADDLKPNYQIVFRHLRVVLEALHTIQLFEVVSDHAKTAFLRTLIDGCLLDAVPETMDDMKETTLVEDVLNFNQFLVDMHFYGESERVELLQFSEKVESLFRHRFSTGILNSAVAIMRKDISDMVLMAPGGSSEEVSAKDDDTTNFTIFPKCMVSKSTVELINLMGKIMREIDLLGSKREQAVAQGGGDTDPTVIQLLSIISVILDRYITEVPSYHKKLLTRIPHLTALFHNNCMYLAFWIGKRESVLNISGDSQLLIDLKRLGVEYLTEQVASQRSQIMEIMRDFDLNDSLTELPQGVYRCVRQCLRQMDLLKNVWQSILPEAGYNMHMGALLTDFVQEVIRRIMALEDIATPIANGLVDVIGLIVERAPTIFAVSCGFFGNLTDNAMFVI